MLILKLTDHNPARLNSHARRDFNQSRVVPKRLRLREVEAVLTLVFGAYLRVLLETYACSITYQTFMRLCARGGSRGTSTTF
jgi:hypothetical protein